MFTDNRFLHQTQASEGDVKSISVDSALVAIGCALLLYAISWLSGCGTAPTPKQHGGKKLTSPTGHSLQALEEKEEKAVTPISGRRLTVEKMAQRAATSLQFSNEEFGVALDAPRGYMLKEGDLSEMDRGLGYLGPIPMHFSVPNGIRLVTVEPPVGVHMGSDFVNEFFTLSAQYGETEASCVFLNIPAERRGEAITRTVDGFAFRGFAESSAASLHQYTGRYLHAYTNDTCYEIGYGVATIGLAGGAHLKKIDPAAELQKLEKILDTVHINPPEFERNSATD